jgi:hypothetical protein
LTVLVTEGSAGSYLAVACAVAATAQAQEDNAFDFKRTSFSFHAPANGSVFPGGNGFYPPTARGQNRIASTIAQTIPHPIHVMFG